MWNALTKEIESGQRPPSCWKASFSYADTQASSHLDKTPLLWRLSLINYLQFIVIIYRSSTLGHFYFYESNS